MNKIAMLIDKINALFEAKLEELFKMPFSEFLNKYFDMFNNLPDLIKAIILMAVSVLLLIGLYRIIKKSFKFFLMMGVLGAIVYFLTT